MDIGARLHRRFVTFEADGGIQITASQTETQRVEQDLAVGQFQVSTQIAQRQGFTMLDTFGAEFHISVHYPPAFGIEFLHRQYFVGRLPGSFTTFGFVLVRIGTNQRSQISKAQLF